MKISRIELFEIRMPLVHYFETSFGRTEERRIILCRIEDAEGRSGWGECTCGETPSYSEEWTESCWVTLEEVLAPMLLASSFRSASEVWQVFSAVRGNRMSKAALETAVWDLEAKRFDVPLWKLVGGTRREIKCGVSIGIQDTVDDLIGKIRLEIEAGYQRIKIKIAPGWDVGVIKDVRDEFGDIELMADANSAYTLSDRKLLKSLDKFGLMMIEQPLAHDDIVDHRRLQRKISTPVCLDESIHSPADARKAIGLGSCRIINIKLGRVGGHSQANEIETICRRAEIPVWCGGMLEAGIGRAHNIAMSTMEGFTLPGDVSASKRYWKEDIIEPEVEVSPDGMIAVPDQTGIGYRVRRGRIDSLTVRKTAIRS